MISDETLEEIRNCDEWIQAYAWNGKEWEVLAVTYMKKQFNYCKRVAFDEIQFHPQLQKYNKIIITHGNMSDGSCFIPKENKKSFEQPNILWKNF